MTKYGSTDEMEKLAWGGPKASTPPRVTAVQNQVTSLINLVLNRTEDYSTVPEEVMQVANTAASEILRPGGDKLTVIQILDMLKVLLMSYMDQAPTGQTNWGNVRWIN
jgi:hypothetical protein